MTKVTRLGGDSEAMEAADLELKNEEMLPQPQVEVTFQGAKTYVEEMPELGDDLRFEIAGYVRMDGERLDIETGESRQFVQVKVTHLKVL